MINITRKSFPAGLVQSTHPTGSKYICNPPVLTTDEDYFVLTTNKNSLLAYLINSGWDSCLKTIYNDASFLAFRKGTLNIIVLWDSTLYTKCVMSTELAKRFNLTNKEDRVDLFELVRNGYYGERLLGI